MINQDPQLLSVEEFASRIKSKYPEYQDMDDYELAERIIAKYPEYKDKVDFQKKKNDGSYGVASEEMGEPSGEDLSPVSEPDSSTIQTEESETSELETPSTSTDFDPEGDGYDYETAKKHGIQADETGHWPSRVPETGQILKGRKHPTYDKAINAEKSLGNSVHKGSDGRYYSKVNEEKRYQVADEGKSTVDWEEGSVLKEEAPTEIDKSIDQEIGSPIPIPEGLSGIGDEFEKGRLEFEQAERQKEIASQVQTQADVQDIFAKTYDDPKGGVSLYTKEEKARDTQELIGSRNFVPLGHEEVFNFHGKDSEDAKSTGIKTRNTLNTQEEYLRLQADRLVKGITMPNLQRDLLKFLNFEEPEQKYDETVLGVPQVKEAMDAIQMYRQQMLTNTKSINKQQRLVHSLQEVVTEAKDKGEDSRTAALEYLEKNKVAPHLADYLKESLDNPDLLSQNVSNVGTSIYNMFRGVSDGIRSMRDAIIDVFDENEELTLNDEVRKELASIEDKENTQEVEDLIYGARTSVHSGDIYEYKADVDGVKVIFEDGVPTGVRRASGDYAYSLTDGEKAALKKASKDPDAYKDNLDLDFRFKALSGMGTQVIADMVPMIAVASLTGGSALGVVGGSMAVSFGDYYNEEFERTGDRGQALLYGGLTSAGIGIVEAYVGPVEKKLAQALSGGKTAVSTMAKRAARETIEKSVEGVVNPKFYYKALAKSMAKDFGGEYLEEFSNFPVEAMTSMLFGREYEVTTKDLITTLAVTPFATAGPAVISNYAQNSDNLKTDIMVSAQNPEAFMSALDKWRSSAVTEEEKAFRNEQYEVKKKVVEQVASYIEESKGMSVDDVEYVVGTALEASSELIKAGTVTSEKYKERIVSRAEKKFKEVDKFLEDPEAAKEKEKTTNEAKAPTKDSKKSVDKNQQENKKEEAASTGESTTPVQPEAEGEVVATEPKTIEVLEEENKSTSPKVRVEKVFSNKKGVLTREERSGVDETIEKGEVKNLPVESIPVESIVPTQTNLTIPNLKETENVKEVDVEEEILVVEKDGKYFVIDGHHRLANSILKGDKEVNVRVYKKEGKPDKYPRVHSPKSMNTDKKSLGSVLNGERPVALVQVSEKDLSDIDRNKFDVTPISELSFFERFIEKLSSGEGSWSKSAARAYAERAHLVSSKSDPSYKADMIAYLEKNDGFVKDDTAEDAAELGRLLRYEGTEEYIKRRYPEAKPAESKAKPKPATKKLSPRAAAKKAREKGKPQFSKESGTGLKEKLNPIYSARFVAKDEQERLKKEFPPVHPNEFYHHSTIEFKPDNIDNLEFGKYGPMKITGRLTTDKVDVLLVENPKSTNKHPHITLSTAEGVKPFQSNGEIEANLDKVKPVNMSIAAVDGVFNGRDITSLTVPKKNTFDKKEPFTKEYPKEAKDAIDFAKEAHGDQKRKYTGLDYTDHLEEVAAKVAEYTDDIDIIRAAILHDTIEDTEATYEELVEKFGERVANTVQELSDEFIKSKYPTLNRKARKGKEAERLSKISDEAKLIKAADQLNNTQDIAENDPKFAEVYLAEAEVIANSIDYGTELHKKLKEKISELKDWIKTIEKTEPIEELREETRVQLRKEAQLRKTEPTESKDDFEAIVDEMNKMDSPNLMVDLDTPIHKEGVANIEEVKSRKGLAVLPKILKSLSFLEGLPAMLTISDTLAAGIKKNPLTGNVIKNLFGGLLFNYTKGNTEFAWAYTDFKAADSVLKAAKGLYTKNKELFEAAWDSGKIPRNVIPVLVGRMGDDAVSSNEAVVRVLQDNLHHFPRKNKSLAFKALKADFTEQLKTIEASINDNKQKLAALKKAGKNFATPKNAITNLVKAKSAYSNALQIAEEQGTFDGFVDNITSLLIGHRPFIIKRMTIGSAGELPKSFDSKPNQAKPITVALLEGLPYTDQKKIHLGFTTDILMEEAIRNVPKRHIISVIGIDVSPDSKPIKSNNHPNYPYNLKGMGLGVLENPRHLADVIPAAYGNAVKKTIDTKNNKITNKSAISNAIPNAMNNTVYRNKPVSMDTSDRSKLIGFLQMAYPNVQFFTDQDTWDSVIKRDGVKQYIKDGDIVYGLTQDGTIYINPKFGGFNTPIHETGHIWIDNIEATNKPLFDQGLALVEGTKELKVAIKDQGDTVAARKEALAVLIGNRGETLATAAQRNKFKNWLKSLWDYIQSKFKSLKGLTTEEISNLTLEEFVDGALLDMFSAEEQGTKSLDSNAQMSKKGDPKEELFGDMARLKDEINSGEYTAEEFFEDYKEDLGVDSMQDFQSIWDEGINKMNTKGVPKSYEARELLQYIGLEALLDAVKSKGLEYNRVPWARVEPIAEEVFQAAKEKGNFDEIFNTILDATDRQFNANEDLSTLYAQVYHKVIYHFRSIGDMDNFLKWNNEFSESGRSKGRFIAAMQQDSTPDAIINNTIKAFYTDKAEALDKNHPDGGSVTENIAKEQGTVEERVRELVKSGMSNDQLVEELLEIMNTPLDNSFKAKINKAAKRILALKIDASDLGFSQVIPIVSTINAAIELAVATLRTTGKLVEAIDKGIRYIKNNDAYKDLANDNQRRKALKVFESKVRQGYKEPEIVTKEALQEIVDGHFSDRTQKEMDLKNRLIQKFGLDEDQAKEVEEKIMKGVEEKVESELRQRLGLDKQGDPKLKPTKKKLTEVDSIIANIRMGAVSSSTFQNHFAKKYGFAFLTQKDITFLENITGRIMRYNGKELSYALQKQLSDHIALMQKMNAAKFYGILMSLTIKAALTGLQTMIVNIPVGSMSAYWFNMAPKYVKNRRAWVEFDKVWNEMGLAGMGKNSLMDVFRSGFNEIDIDDKNFGMRGNREGDAIDAYMNSLPMRSIAKELSSAKNGREMFQAAAMLVTKPFMTLLKFANTAKAFDVLMTHKGPERVQFIDEWNAAAKALGGNNLFGKDTKAILEKVYEQMGYIDPDNPNKASLKERVAAQRAAVEKEVDEHIQDALFNSLYKESYASTKGYRQRAVKIELQRKRDQTKVAAAIELVKSFTLMNDPQGMGGRFYQWFRRSTKIDQKDGYFGGGINHFAAAGFGLFMRIGITSGQMSLRYMPVIGLWNSLINYRQKADKSWDWVWLPKLDRQEATRRAVTHVALLAAGAALFATMFDEDEEGNLILNPDSPIRITGTGSGNYKDLDSFRLVNDDGTSIERENLTAYIKINGNWRVLLSGKLIPPLMPMFALFGGLSDGILMGEFIEGELNLKNLNTTYDDMLMVTSEYSFNAMPQAMVNYFYDIRKDGSRGFLSRTAKIFMRPMKTAIFPNLARDLLNEIKAYKGTSKRTGLPFHKAMYGNLYLSEYWTDSVFRAQKDPAFYNMTDAFGYEIKHTSKIKGAINKIPILQQLVDFGKENDWRFEEPVWKLHLNNAGVIVPTMWEGADDKEKIQNATRAGLYLRNLVEENYEWLSSISKERYGVALKSMGTFAKARVRTERLEQYVGEAKEIFEGAELIDRDPVKDVKRYIEGKKLSDGKTFFILDSLHIPYRTTEMGRILYGK